MVVDQTGDAECNLNSGFKFTLNSYCLSMQDIYLELKQKHFPRDESIHHEHFFHQQIGLKYNEETSDILR